MNFNLVKRYLIMAVGLFTMTIGIALSTKAQLGTTPISSIPFVLNIATGISLGTYTMIFNFLLVGAQFVLLRRNFTAHHLIQILVTFVFGIFTDISVALVSGINPDGYVMCWLLTVVSSMVLALGIFIEVSSKTSMMPGEGIVLAVSETFRLKFSKVKIALDVTWISIAAVMSLILFGKLCGVREGTVFAAVFVGLFIRAYSAIVRKVKPSEEESIS